jgi:hypothetical protein
MKHFLFILVGVLTHMGEQFVHITEYYKNYARGSEKFIQNVVQKALKQRNHYTDVSRDEGIMSVSPKDRGFKYTASELVARF